MKVTDKKLRERLSRGFKEMNQIYKQAVGKGFSLGDLDQCLAHIRSEQRISVATNCERLYEKFSLSSLGIAALGLLGVSVYSRHQEDELLPATWLSDDGRPNPNHVIQCLLVQLTNYCISSADLLTKGLDNPARTLLRAASELSQQLLVLLASQSDMLRYSEGHDEDSSTAIWHELFARGRLGKKIQEIEEALDLPQEIVDEMGSSRKFNQKHYSQAVHHSFIATMVGAYAGEFDSEGASLGVFSSENSHIEGALDYLNFIIWYFFVAFFAILDKIHSIRPRNPSKDFWVEAFMLHICYRDAYVSLSLRASRDDEVQTAENGTVGA